MGGTITAKIYVTRNKLSLSCSPDGKPETKDDRQEDEVFEIDYHGEGRLTIRSRQGHYLTAYSDGSCQFDSDIVQESTYFKLSWKESEGFFLLRSAHGQYLGVDGNGMVICSPDRQPIAWERVHPESHRQKDDQTESNRKAGTLDNLASINPVDNDTPMDASSNQISSRNSRVRPDSGNGQDAERESSETKQFFILTPDELNQSDIDIELVVLMIAQFKKREYNEYERERLKELIEKLSKFPELENLSTDQGGKTSDQFIDLRSKFEPMNNMYFTKAPDNLHKLYDLLWVKIKDITSGSLDTRFWKPSSLMMDCAPNVQLFCSSEQPKRNTDYYCSLIKMKTLRTMSSKLVLDENPFFIDQKSAKTQLAKSHAQSCFAYIRPWIIFTGILQLILTALISLHIISWRDDDFNDVVIPLILIIDIIFMMTSPINILIILLYVVMLFTVCCYCISDRLEAKKLSLKRVALRMYDNQSDFWRSLQSLQMYFLMVYIILYDEDEKWFWLLAISCFFVYLKLISYARLRTSWRRLVAVMVHVAGKSVKFYAILMTIIFGACFGMMALRKEDQYDFRNSFQLTYRLAFGDFEEPEKYSTRSELVGFILISFVGPLLLLNLLVAIMGTAQEDFLSNYEVNDIRELYSWTKDSMSQWQIAALLWVKIFSCFECIRNRQYNIKNGRTGYIHYCIPDPTTEEDDLSEEWQGQVHAIKQYIDQSLRPIHSFILGNIVNGEAPRTNAEVAARTDDYSGPQMTSQDEAIDLIQQIERKNAERHEALERNNAERLQALEKSFAERHEEHQKDLDDKINQVDDKINQVDDKINQVLELLKASKTSS